MGRWGLEADTESPPLQVRKNFVLELVPTLIFFIIFQISFIFVLYAGPIWILDFLILIAPISGIIAGILRDRAYKKTIYRILGKKFLIFEILLWVCYFIIILYLLIFYFRSEQALELFLMNPLHIFLYILSIAIIATDCYLIYFEFRKLIENPNLH